MSKKVIFGLEQQSVIRINNFIGSVNLGEEEGVIDYKKAYFALKNLVVSNLKTFEIDGPEETDL
jgi:hypothetical protein